MPKDLLKIALERNIATAEELGDKDRVKALKAKLAAHQKLAAKVEADAEKTTSAKAEKPAEPSKEKK